MNTHTMNAESQRLSIYDPKRDRMISLNPYKAKAKEIYRHYIEDLGFDPSLVLPPDLVYYEKSGYFRRNPTKQVKIEGRTAYKSYLASFTLHNVNQVHDLEGFKDCTRCGTGAVALVNGSTRIPVFLKFRPQYKSVV